MRVKELIEILKKLPQNYKVIMFDGPLYYTPHIIKDVKDTKFKDDKKFKECVIID